jgi:ABC-type cobalamin/Fe3+-siderophores transport system ATPase subunit
MSFNGVLGPNGLGALTILGSLEGGNLPEDGTLYTKKTKIKSQKQYKK